MSMPFWSAAFTARSSTTKEDEQSQSSPRVHPNMPNDKQQEIRESQGEKPSSYQNEDSHITDPSPDDVLMGRGAPSTDFPGNMRFRDLVKERREEYINAKRRKEKQIIAGEIIATIKSRGGRFLERKSVVRKTNKQGETVKITVWEPVEDLKTLLVKVKQLMRDVGPEAQEKRNMRREQRKQAVLQPQGESKEDKTDSTVSASPPSSTQPANVSNFLHPQVLANPIHSLQPPALNPGLQLTSIQLPHQRILGNAQIGQLSFSRREVELRLLEEQLRREQQLRLLAAVNSSLGGQPWLILYPQVQSIVNTSTASFPSVISSAGARRENDSPDHPQNNGDSRSGLPPREN